MSLTPQTTTQLTTEGDTPEADNSPDHRRYYSTIDPMDEPSDLRPDLLVDQADGREYWESVGADDDGMLGGIPQLAPYISRIDLQGSRAFLARLGIGRMRGRATVERVLEGGAGIGRVTRGLLVDVGTQVDVIEPIKKFTSQLEHVPGVGIIMNIGLEEWEPEHGATPYDLIWNQLCLGHLRDEQLVQYLGRCRAALSEYGVVVVKENVTRGGYDTFDVMDSSVTRGDQSYQRIFAAAGLKIVRTELQKGLPSELYPIRMYALKPAKEQVPA